MTKRLSNPTIVRGRHEKDKYLEQVETGVEPTNVLFYTTRLALIGVRVFMSFGGARPDRRRWMNERTTCSMQTFILHERLVSSNCGHYMHNGGEFECVEGGVLINLRGN